MVVRKRGNGKAPESPALLRLYIVVDTPRRLCMIRGVPIIRASASSGRSGDHAGYPILYRHTPPRHTSTGSKLENLTSEYSPVFPSCSG
jgi:hypothetical protein